jgi:DNA-directed RNA polymerase subunit L
MSNNINADLSEDDNYDTDTESKADAEVDADSENENDTQENSKNSKKSKTKENSRRTTVSEIKRHEYKISEDTIELCKKLNCLQFLPTNNYQKLSFVLNNVRIPMANSIRRMGDSEIPISIMTFQDNTIDTDDRFIIEYVLKKRVNLIPILQTHDKTWMLDVYNPSDVDIAIYSNEIKIKGDAAASFNEKMFHDTFLVTMLRPGKYLKIDNIYTTSGQAYKDGAQFSIDGKIGYECLDIETQPLGQTSLGKTDSSLVSNIDKTLTSLDEKLYNWKITIPPQSFIDPLQIVKQILKNINDRLVAISEIVSTSHPTDNLYTSEMEIVKILKKRQYEKVNTDSQNLKDLKVKMPKNETTLQFKIYNETYTIAGLLSEYVRNADSTLTSAYHVKEHPSHNFIYLYITHNNPKKLLITAIINIQKDLESIGSYF